MSDISAFYTARDAMVVALRDELIGSEADAVVTETPMNRFVTGILYPQDAEDREADDLEDNPESERQSPETGEDADTFEVVDTPVALSHVRYPSAFGLSFSVDATTRDIRATVSAARYVDEGGRWHRRPTGPVELDVPVHTEGSHSLTVVPDLELRVVVRRARDGVRPITLALVNTTLAPRQGLRDGHAWYQVALTVDHLAGFLDRPSVPSTGLDDEDVASNRLLFRNARNLAVGHGCAVAWRDEPQVTRLTMSFLPTHDVTRADTRIPGVPELPMSAFAAPDGGAALVAALLSRYRAWIDTQRALIPSLGDDALAATASSHLDSAEQAADRIEAGFTHLQNHPDAMRAFNLMNRAMLDQRNRQELIRNGSAPAEQFWRPFQLAFVLLNIKGLSDPSDPERDLADLLWFPTGGGKTEAYLGLIGYTILLRRLTDPQHAGVSVLMRYTLRLLTLQQFERAAGLICALEVIRRSELPHLAPISLGLWVGQDATPNNIKDAMAALRKLKRGETVNKSNPMQLTRCPWCGSKLTTDAYRVRPAPTQHLAILCPDAACAFHDGIPAHVVDSDVYAARPSLVIGTVDKFAMMAWRAEAQSLFSVDGKNPRPDLIVQDELHLISGPLGTMVGLYETAVDAACTQDGHRPKLIASTATIRRASAQMASVFDRSARQFPPPGLDAGDSFFSRDADPSEIGTRQYVGVMAQGITHTYLMVRVYAALMQGARELDAPDDVRDAYWTLMGYFNSLRVLGGASMQVTDDVDAQMQVIASRHDMPKRDLGEPKELTSRVASSEIPERLQELARPYGGTAAPLDAVLATNMISVGLDVDRLGLMAVMGQPQATAEYIQATSRVGRRHPGLVIAIYNSTRSRDLSHYESFSTYHRSLYRQVEPNSATPFSPRARDRGLHGALVALTRHTTPSLAADADAGAVASHPEALEPAVAAIVERATRVSPEEAPSTRAQLERLVEAWIDKAEDGSLRYPGWNTSDGVLLVQAGTTLAKSARDEGAEPLFPVGDAPWATLTSLRDVDAVSNLFLISEKGPK